MASNDHGPISSGILTPRFTPRGFLNPRYISQRAIDTNGAPVWIPTITANIAVGDTTAAMVVPEPEDEDPSPAGGGIGPGVDADTDLTGLSESNIQSVMHYRGASPTQAQYADSLRAYQAQSEAAPVIEEGTYQKKPKRTKTLRDGGFRFLPTKDPTPVERPQGKDWLEQQAKDLPL